MGTTEAFIRKHLEDVPWVRDLPQPVRDRVIEEATESSHSKTDVLSRAGDRANSWLYVAEGLLKVSAINKRGRLIMYTGVPEGSWIGEGAVIKRELRKYDIVATRDSRVIHIPAPIFRWLLDTSIEFNHFMVAQLNERLSQYISIVDIDRMQDPVARVANSIALLFNPILYPRMTSVVPLSQTEIGELVGLSRQSVASAIKRLERDGLVKIGYGTFVVLNLRGLREYEDHA